MTTQMNSRQGNTPPTWLGRARWSLVKDCIGGLRQNRDKLVDTYRMAVSVMRPAQVHARLERLKRLGHCDVIPTMPQLLIGSRDQLSFSLGADTREFYRAQGIPWVFHNLRRFIAYPTTMMDPVGLFSSRETIIQHVLQTFHRHATYDLVLLHGHEGGLEAMVQQLEQLAQGTHPHQRSLDALVEDGSYHARLQRDVPEFVADPFIQARALPEDLVDDKYLMLAMDQFKDLRGYTNYASRLPVGPQDVWRAALELAFNETVGDAFKVRVGPKTLCVEACCPELVQRHLGVDKAA